MSKGLFLRAKKAKRFPLNQAETSTLPETPYKALVRELNLFNNKEPERDEVVNCFTESSKKGFLELWEEHEKKYRQLLKDTKGIKIICGFKYNAGILLMIKLISPKEDLTFPQSVYFVKEGDVWKKQTLSLVGVKYPRARLATYLSYCLLSGYSILDLAEEIK